MAVMKLIIIKKALFFIIPKKTKALSLRAVKELAIPEKINRA
jgi:hypothetical protein